jgi:hypothetical protein
MNFWLLFVISLPFTVCAEPLISGNYWQCITTDRTNKHWTAVSIYQKIAQNFAFASCKKESTTPTSCKTSRQHCEQFIDGVSVQPMWECLALDRTAAPWRSNRYSNRWDAALGAKAYCQQKSVVPGTCYVNLVTCVNKNSLDK